MTTDHSTGGFEIRGGEKKDNSTAYFTECPFPHFRLMCLCKANGRRRENGIVNACCSTRASVLSYAIRVGRVVPGLHAVNDGALVI
jgi:hypothetical protein